MKLVLLVIFLSIAGCLPLEIRKDLEMAQQDVADLQLRLKSAEAAGSPTIPQIRADLQVAEAELSTAKAEAVRSRVNAGFEYTEAGARLIATPLQLLLPGAGTILTALIGLIGAARTMVLPKSEAK